LITVLALAIDPFTQQILHPVLCHRTAPNSVAAIPRAHNLTGIGFHTGAGSSVLEPKMSAAITVGLLNNPQSIEFSCSTGNCTFRSAPGSSEAFQTLGIESACVDVSKEIKEVGKGHWYIPQLGDNSTAVGGPNVTRSMLGYNGTVFQSYWPDESENAHYLLSFAVLTINVVDWSCVRTASPQNYVTCIRPFAAECRLWPAVQTVSTSVDLGKLEEKVLRSEPLSWRSYDLPFLHLSSEVLRNGSWNTCVPSPSMSIEAQVPVFNHTLGDPGRGDNGSEKLQWYPQDCVWVIGYDTDLALQSVLYPLFSNKVLLLVYGVLNAEASYGDQWIRNLYNNGSASLSTIERYVANLASSMTAYGRMNPKRDQSLGYEYGYAVRTETCIQVRWAWVAFPASLVLLTFLFLTLTIWRTHKQRHDHSESERGAWKSSTLAVLFAGFSDTAQRELGSVDKKSDMIDRAGEMRVSLTRTDDGWKLRSA
jgi:hypothetical protein